MNTVSRLTHGAAIVPLAALMLAAQTDYVLAQSTTLDVRTNQSVYQDGDPIHLFVSVTVVDPDARVIRVPDDTSPTPPLDLSLHVRYVQSGQELTMLGSAAKRRPSGWKEVTLAAGKSKVATYELRSLYAMPWPEVGDYTISAEWQGASSEFSFSIVERKNVVHYDSVEILLLPPVEGIGVVRHRFWVIDDPGRAQDQSLLYQRVDTQAHPVVGIATIHAFDQLVLTTRRTPAGWHQRVFVAWTDGDGLHYTDVRSDQTRQYPIRSIMLSGAQSGDLRIEKHSQDNDVSLMLVGADGENKPLANGHVLDIAADGQMKPQ